MYRRMRKLLPFLALLVIGCGWQPDAAKIVSPPDGVDVAYASVAASLNLREIPLTYWYAGDDCGGGAIHDPMGECVWGFRRDGIVVLSAQDGIPIHETALAHEWAHAAAEERTGDSDNACHASAFFRDMGDVRDCLIPSDQRGLVGAANRTLEAMGR